MGIGLTGWLKKGVRNLLGVRPERCGAEKVPDTFSTFSPRKLAVESLEVRAMLAPAPLAVDFPPADVGQFVTMPYLQNVTPESVAIMWELDALAPLSVEYGLTAGYGSSIAAVSEPSGYFGTQIYKAELSGLLPESQYHYRLVSDGGTPQTGDRLFTTGTTAEIDFAFGAWSDSQGSNHGVWSADPLQPTTSMMAHMAQSGVAFGFDTGDLAESGNSYFDVRNYYLDRVAKFLGQTVPWFNAWGNHDTSNRNAILRRFADMPSEQRPGFTSGFGSFYFTYANTLFIALDYYDYGVITSGWLEDLLQSEINQNARFTVVGVHVPPYSERWIDGDSFLRSNLVPLMEQYGVDICLSGHTHEYARGFLNGVYYVMTGGGSWLDFPEALVRDWPHMTVGGYHDVPGNWARESAPGVLGPPQPIRGGLVNEYVRFEIRGNHMQVEMHGFNADGSYLGVLDSFAFGDTPGVNDPPAFDTSLLEKPPATAWWEYDESVSGDASDPDAGDVLTFSKTSGPAWLNVDPDGTLSGVPGPNDLGENSFTVRVTDAEGLYHEATLQITVNVGSAVVVGRHVFYNNSAFDTGPGKTDDDAIAPDKTALRPGEAASFEHYTSYVGGINGIMVDIAGLAGTPTADDFRFKVGNGERPFAAGLFQSPPAGRAGWADAPKPLAVTVRPGEGSLGSDRVTIVWNDRAIQKQWLQVTVRPTANTGLMESDVFYFGNAVGETGNSAGDAKVTVLDMLGARDNPRSFLNPAPLDFAYDFNRDGRVNSYDLLIARDNQTHFLDALRLWTKTPAVLITEAGTAKEDYVEIQNLGDSTVDTSGWFVVANNADDGGHPPDINAWHATVWNLPDSTAAGQVLYRTDDDQDLDNYWGENLFWRVNGNGWVMIVDDEGQVADFVVWGYDRDEIAALNIHLGGFDLAVGSAWSGASVPTEGRFDNSLQRSGSADHDDASDWAFRMPPSKGQPNADLFPPFSTGGAPGKSATRIDEVPARDAALELAFGRGPESRAIPPHRLAWLHEFEQIHLPPGRGLRNFLWAAPFGPFRQKVPETFSKPAADQFFASFDP